ncbi:hypothetical protein CFP65_0916 [Kitasatospora sp. MMS16-BH015]|uniref:hypothetical protein n=1 Tax=Kitasatospora sp. MMS16-BH015 TaxID=2018025 RepID=UPI000CA09CA2|nr:hypothetical protein [Kitasatospora sp. MMS16-BH015]AUG75837.1 hypothetical protein CFP65_0916 [Kitasatospora sp. MMS16-BH015]
MAGRRCRWWRGVGVVGLAAGAAIGGAGVGWAEDGPAAVALLEKPPVAQAMDGDRPLAGTGEVTKECAKAGACSFRLYDRKPREFTSGVLSVGNAAINCTNGEMEVDRTVTFVTSSTDNIGGEISGKAAIEGGVDTTVTVSASGTLKPGMDNSITQFGPNKDKGPSTGDTVKNSFEAPVTVTGSNALHLGVKASYESAFKASFSKTWQVQTTESTRVVFKVKANDEVQFGVANASSRTVGELLVNGLGKLIKNVAVDSPSTVNASSVVAQTFSAKDKCLSLRAVPSGLVETAPMPAGRVPDAVYVRTALGTWEQR